MKKLQAQCDAFNARTPIGTKVNLVKDGGEIIETVTLTQAEVLGGHSAVIWLKGIRGCYLLDRVTAIDASPTAIDANHPYGIEHPVIS